MDILNRYTRKVLALWNMQDYYIKACEERDINVPFMARYISKRYERLGELREQLRQKK